MKLTEKKLRKKNTRVIPSISKSVPLSPVHLYVGDLQDNGSLPFVEELNFESVWQAVLTKSEYFRKTDIDSYISEFCDMELHSFNNLSLIKGLHHVALYLGDFDDDQQVINWFAFLKEQIGTSHGLLSVDMGPSYIAPKQYGTPGWWYSLKFSDDFVIEMFCCRSFGNWPNKKASERVDLMSHIAVEITTEEGVKEAIENLCENAFYLENIAYIESDEMGHTYGHIRNNDSKRVLELVHQGPVKTTKTPPMANKINSEGTGL